jgi:hypothetical protein
MAMAAVVVRRLEVLRLLDVEQREVLCAVVAAGQELQFAVDAVVAAEREVLCAVVAAGQELQYAVDAKEGPVLAMEQLVLVMEMARIRKRMEINMQALESRREGTGKRGQNRQTIATAIHAP